MDIPKYFRNIPTSYTKYIDITNSLSNIIIIWKSYLG